MGLFDFITGNRAADSSVPRIARDELYLRLLAVTEPSGVWHVQPAQDEGRADLVAEWHRSAGWDRIFGAAERNRWSMGVLDGISGHRDRHVAGETTLDRSRGKFAITGG